MSKKNLYFAALLMASATFTACSSNESDDSNGNQSQVYTLTVEGTKGDDSEYTRALSESNNTIYTTWDKDADVIKVYNSANAKIADIRPATSTRISKMSGYIVPNTTLNVGDKLDLYYPFRDTTGPYFFYLYQDGTLATISQVYDYAKADDIEVKTKSGNNYTAASANFKNQQAIVRFTLLDTSNNPINPKYLYISGERDEQSVLIVWENALESDDRMGKSTNVIIIKPSGSTNVVYAALRGLDTPGKVKITAETANGTKYYFPEKDVTFKHGKYYQITVKMMTKSEVSAAGVTGTVMDYFPGYGDDPDPDFDVKWGDYYNAFRTLRGLQ